MSAVYSFMTCPDSQPNPVSLLLVNPENIRVGGF